MAIDASIPLQVKSPLQSAQQYMSLKNAMQEQSMRGLALKQQQNQMQDNAQIKGILADPNSYTTDQFGTRTLKPQTIDRVMGVSPQVGMSLQSSIQKTQMMKINMQKSISTMDTDHLKQAQTKMGMLADVSASTVDVYDHVLQNTKNPQAADQAAKQAFGQQLQSMVQRGVITPQHAQSSLQGFDINKARTLAHQSHTWLAMANYRQKVSANQEKVRHDRMMEGAGFGTSAGNAAPSNLNGDAYLKTLTPVIGNQVKALAQGRMQFPAGFALKSPYWQKMIQRVSQYDPSFDAVNYNARARLRTDFTSGKAGQSITALNTVIGHLDSLSKAADSLNNSSIGAYNKVANFLASNTGDPRVKNFNATKKAVVDELTRVWRGSGGSEGDIKSWSQTLENSDSPAQFHSVIAQIGHLLKSKIDSLAAQYQQGMGTTGQGLNLITPQASQTLQRLTEKDGQQPMDVTAQVPGQTPDQLQGQPPAQPQGQPDQPQGQPPQGNPNQAAMIDQAKQAIAQGAPREAVLARLKKLGISPQGL